MVIDRNDTSHLKKSWVISTMIARELLLCQNGDRLPAIQEYADRFTSSRGIVQNALARLQECGAVLLEKRGKRGTFLQHNNRAALLEAAGLLYITGSMAPPVNISVASLATGICLSFGGGPPSFNFAFMHSSENRAKALSRMVCQFVVVSRHSAEVLVRKYPDLAVALTLDGSAYESPLCLWSNRADVSEIKDGDSIAVDPNSNDQYEVTMRLCAGKQVRIQQEPYLSTRLSLINRKVDFVVLRQNEGLADCFALPIGQQQTVDMTVPAVLVNRNDYCMDCIVREFLDLSKIARVQGEVLNRRRLPEFY